MVELANISLHKKLKEDDLQASNFLCLLLLYSAEENLNLPICLIRLVMWLFSHLFEGGTVSLVKSPSQKNSLACSY